MIRNDFPILNKRINGRPLVYFDNAASLQKPGSVIAAVADFYKNSYANVHRAFYSLSEEATDLYEESRRVVAEFIGASPAEVVYTRGATEAINLVARSWGMKNLRAGDRVVLSRAEHHANIVPWLQLKSERGIILEYIDLHPDGSLNFKSAAMKLELPRVKLLSVTHVSNVLGLVNPVSRLVKVAAERGVLTLVDASQSVVHLPLDVQKIACDFLVFSGHKLGGPTGIGVLYGRQEILGKMPPFMGGGDMIETVGFESFTAAPSPRKFEAGTPPISSAIGLAAGVRYLEEIGWKKIRNIEDRLTDRFMENLKSRPYLNLLGKGRKKIPVFSLLIDKVHPHDAADWLDRSGIAVRAGFHCAEPLHRYFGVAGTLRASLSFYNSLTEVDYFFKKIDALYKALSR